MLALAVLVLCSMAAVSATTTFNFNKDTDWFVSARCPASLTPSGSIR
jgi:hypothetical protein